MSNNRDVTEFLIETGNWRASIKLPVRKSDVGNYEYIEAATVALECVFDESKDIGENFEMVNLLDDKGKNYFDEDYGGALSDIPDSTFGLLCACFLAENANKQERWWYFLSSKIFANAGQHCNAALAEKVEKKYSKEVEEFKKQEIKLIELDANGELEQKLADVRRKMKKKKPPQDE